MPKAVTPNSLRIFRKPGSLPRASSELRAHPSPVTTESIERTLQRTDRALPPGAVRRAANGFSVVGLACQPLRRIGRLEPSGAWCVAAARGHRGRHDPGRAGVLLLLRPDRVR